jgi:hypothetical protein
MLGTIEVDEVIGLVFLNEIAPCAYERFASSFISHLFSSMQMLASTIPEANVAPTASSSLRVFRRP